jgi:hypothetical protein
VAKTVLERLRSVGERGPAVREQLSKARCANEIPMNTQKEPQPAVSSLTTCPEAEDQAAPRSPTKLLEHALALEDGEVGPRRHVDVLHCPSGQLPGDLAERAPELRILREDELHARIGVVALHEQEMLRSLATSARQIAGWQSEGHRPES